MTPDDYLLHAMRRYCRHPPNEYGAYGTRGYFWRQDPRTGMPAPYKMPVRVIEFTYQHHGHLDNLGVLDLITTELGIVYQIEQHTYSSDGTVTCQAITWEGIEAL